MTRRNISTGKLSEAKNAHSAGVVASGDFLFTSGITPRDDAGNIVGAGDMAAQIDRTLNNLDDVLRAAGCGFADVVKLTVFVTDIDAYRDARGSSGARIDSAMSFAPASTLVEVSRLADPEMMVEIEAIALIPRDFPSIDPENDFTTT